MNAIKVSVDFNARIINNHQSTKKVLIFETFCGNFHALSNFKYMPDEKPKHSNEKSVACFESLYFWTYLLLNKTHQNLCLVLGPVLCTFFDHCEPQF